MKIYHLLPVILFSLAGCSKEYTNDNRERKLVGSWHLDRIEKASPAGDFTGLVFREGDFTFRSDGAVVVDIPLTPEFSGTWNISTQDGNYCYTGGDGNQVCMSEFISTLDLDTRQVSGSQTKKVHFYSIRFSNNDYFKAGIIAGLHDYIYHFTRN